MPRRNGAADKARCQTRDHGGRRPARSSSSAKPPEPARHRQIHKRCLNIDIGGTWLEESAGEGTKAGLRAAVARRLSGLWFGLNQPVPPETEIRTASPVLPGQTTPSCFPAAYPVRRCASPASSYTIGRSSPLRPASPYVFHSRHPPKLLPPLATPRPAPARVHLTPKPSTIPHPMPRPAPPPQSPSSVAGFLPPAIPPATPVRHRSLVGSTQDRDLPLLLGSPWVPGSMLRATP